MGDRGGASERECFWLKHHEAQAASGKDGKQYAASAGISVQALYQARRRLRARGLLAPGRGRIELPSGAVLEWSGRPGHASLRSS